MDDPQSANSQLPSPNKPLFRKRWPRLVEVKYRKEIHKDDVDRSAGNYAKAGAAGALAGLAFKGTMPKGKRALIGAGAGLAAENIVRQIGSQHRDYYGDRTLASKRAEHIPALAGLGVAGYLGYKRLKAMNTKAVVRPIIKAVTGFERLRKPERGCNGCEAPARLSNRKEVQLSRIPMRLVQFSQLSTRNSQPDREADDLRIQRRKLAFYTGTAALGAGGLAWLVHKSGGEKPETLKPELRAAGRGTVGRLAEANALRNERGYVHLRPLTPGGKKRFARLAPETQKLAGQIEHVARDAANISPGERKIARAAFGKLRGLHKFSMGERKVISLSAFRIPRSEILFGGQQQMRDKNNVFVDPLGVAAGLQEAAVRRNDGSYESVDIPITHAQVLRSAYRRGRDIKRTGWRVGGLVRDTADVVSGAPRRRDELGRPKKREWEKSWFKDAVGSAATGAALLGGAAYLRHNPDVRHKAMDRLSKLKSRVNEHVKDFFPTREYARPLPRRILNLKSKFKNLKYFDDHDRRDAFITGALTAGGLAGIGLLTHQGLKSIDGLQKRGAATIRRIHVSTGKTVNDTIKQRLNPAIEQAKQAAENTKNATALYAEIGKVWRNVKGGAYNVLNPRNTWREMKDAYREGRHGIPAPAPKPRPQWALSIPESGKRIPERILRLSTLNHQPSTFFDLTAPEWDVRDQRGRSARVFAPGSRKRERREKEWHEEVGNQRKILAGLALTGTVGGLLVGRHLIPKPHIPTASKRAVEEELKRLGGNFRVFNPDAA